MRSDARAHAAQGLRFLISGGSGFALYLLLALLFRTTGLQAASSAWLAVMASIVPTFYLQRRFTFRSDGSARVEFAGYAALQLVAAFVIGGAARLLATWGLPDWLAFVIAGAVGVLGSYIIQAVLVFRRR